MNHTPGPWRFTSGETGRNQSSVIRPMVVADCHHTPRHHEYDDWHEVCSFLATSWAYPENAPLIAAAPDLYESLKEMYDWRYVRREVNIQEELDAARDAIYERARLALAKATNPSKAVEE